MHHDIVVVVHFGVVLPGPLDSDDETQTIQIQLGVFEVADDPQTYHDVVYDLDLVQQIAEALLEHFPLEFVLGQTLLVLLTLLEVDDLYDFEGLDELVELGDDPGGDESDVLLVQSQPLLLPLPPETQLCLLYEPSEVEVIDELLQYSFVGQVSELV